jgi:hypothetical protein
VQPDVARHPDAVARLAVQGAQRLVVVVIDLREERQLALAQPLLEAEEAPVPGLGAKALEAADEALPVLGWTGRTMTDEPSRGSTTSCESIKERVPISAKLPPDM